MKKSNCSSGQYMLFDSKENKNVLRLARSAARSQSNLLIKGEMGTGKEKLAQYIHAHSDYKDKPFVTVSSLILNDQEHAWDFGDGENPYNGYDNSHNKSNTAFNGIVFISDVDKLSEINQEKLLRIIEARSPLHNHAPKKSALGIRFFVDTTQDMNEMAFEGRFKLDLYFELVSFEILIPPLRDRPEDIKPMVLYLLDDINESSDRISADAWQALFNHSWPGNFQELRSVIVGGFAQAEPDSILDADDFYLCQSQSMHLDDFVTLEEIEREQINKVLSVCQGNVSKAAETLGISRSSMYNKIKRYHINEDH